MTSLHDEIRRSCQQPVIELPRRAAQELHFVISGDDDLVCVCQMLAARGAALCTIVANDERLLEDHAFKIYYVLAAQTGELVILEHALHALAHYVSIRDSFPAAEPLEHEIGDLFGLTPTNKPVTRHYLLHEVYPEDLYPLRPRRTLERLKETIRKYLLNRPLPPTLPPALPAGMTRQTVGPIHAELIEAGQFIIEGAGEPMEQLSLRPGYKHRGIEKMFETNYTLEHGWQLAERISGDSSFSHALAYCQAVEALAGIEPPAPAHFWRGLLLELERLYNHIADVGAVMHDIGLDLVASDLAVLREQALRLNQRLTGQRLLRGVNRLGGVVLPPAPDLAEVQRDVDTLATQFLELGGVVLRMQSCRVRFVNVGILTEAEVRRTGATGLMARAAGLIAHDVRLRDQHGVFAHDSALRHELLATVTPNAQRPSEIKRRVPVFQRDMRGDSFARLALRIAEVETSARIIALLLDHLRAFDSAAPCVVPASEVARLLRQTPNSEFGLGYVENWRGDLCYWVMKGAGNTIRRCKVRDPSIFNWPAFALAVMPKIGADGRPTQGNMLSDFPLINRSCNLSYAGRDG